MTNRIVIGQLGVGRFGMKASLPGVNALTANDQDPALFSFCSDWANLVRIGASGTGTIAGQASSPTSVGVGHSLGFIPFCEVRSCEGASNTPCNEFAKGAFLGGTNGNETAVRLVADINASSLTIIMNPWIQIAFVGDTPIQTFPGPPTAFFVWFAYRDPHI